MSIVLKIMRYGCVFIVSWMFACAAQATVNVSLTADQIYDSNLFRLSDQVDSLEEIGSRKRDEFISRLGLQLNLDLALSKQRISGHAGYVANRFVRNEQLNNDEQDLLLDWSGELGRLWGGSGKLQRKQNMASFEDFQGNQTNIITHDYVELELRRQLTSKWSMWGAWERDFYSRSLLSQQDNDRRTAGFRLGLTGRTTAGSEVKIIASSRTVNFVNRAWLPGSLQDDELNERRLQLRLKWKLTGNTTADAGIGVERVASPHLPQNDFSNNSYDMALAWRDGGVLNWRAAIWHNIDTLESAYADYVTRYGGRFSAEWQARAKILVRGQLSRKWLHFENGGTVIRADKLRDVSLSLVYIPLRNAELSMMYSRSNRSSNNAFSDFRGYTLQLGAALHWR